MDFFFGGDKYISAAYRSMTWISPFENGRNDTLLFIFPNFYIINLRTIIAIQFLDGVGENIVKLYKPVCRNIQVHQDPTKTAENLMFRTPAQYVYTLFQKKRTFNSEFFVTPLEGQGPKIHMVDYGNGSSIHAKFFSLENLQPFWRYFKMRGSMSQNKNCSFHKSP